MGNAAGRARGVGGAYYIEDERDGSHDAPTPKSGSKEVGLKAANPKAFVDPRSPSKGLSRTPLGERRQNGASGRSHPAPKRLHGTEKALFSEVSDPRSPTVPRSPVRLPSGKQLEVAPLQWG